MCAEKITYNVCMGTGCHEQCILTTYTENGRIVRTERTYVPGTDKPVTGICQKGVIYAKFPYLEHPSRLRYPLKRVGERGEGKFEKISWEQAMDEIGEKLNKIKEESGPEAILVNNFANSIPGAFTALHLALTYRFVHTFGASLLPTPPIDISAGWASIVDVGTVFPYWGFDLDRLASTNYLILWGNAAGWGRAGYTVKKILAAKEKGAKIIDIGSHFEGSASIADEFIPIKPATDYYLAAAMAHILFRDNLIDTDFLTKHTVAPFLVRKDNGKFLREAEIYPQGSAENYLVWNKSPAVPKAVKPHSTIEEEIEPDLFACPVINGIPCTTALVQIRDAVMPYSPKVQEKFTGIDANTVERITHEFTRIDDSLLYLYAGMRYLNGGPAYRAAMMLPILAGKLHKGLGGLVLCLAWNDHPIAFNPQIYFAGDPQEAKGKFPLSLVDALREGFPYRALLNVMANPLQSWPNQQLWSETILPKMELVVAYDVRMSGTARWADYVLPDTCTFERMEIAHSRNRVILCEPAIEPNGDVKAPAEDRRGFCGAVEAEIPKERFLSMVRQGKEHIRAGDVCQVVLSQRFSARTDLKPLEIYRALKRANPSPYMFFLDLGDFRLVGSSPEVLVRLSGNRVTTRPLAGTRRRGKTPAEDRDLERELLADEKERAEHVMLVDLARNDLGKVCRTKSIEVTELMETEMYSQVMHIVSNVEGERREGCGPLEILRAAFPAGTVSGAPKIRAMERAT